MWRRRRPLDGLDDDIRAHIEQDTDDYISRGVAPEEARRLARLSFGNVALVSVVLSLAPGIGANTAIFSLLNAVALRPLPSTTRRAVEGRRAISVRGIPRSGQ